MEADLKAKGLPEDERARQLAELARQEGAQEKELDERFTQVSDQHTCILLFFRLILISPPPLHTHRNVMTA